MGTRGVGARRAGPRARAAERATGSPPRTRDPRARPAGRPLPGGAAPRLRGPGRGPDRAPPGFSPPRCHVPPALRLRDGPAPCSGSAGPGHIGLPEGGPLGTGRGAKPAGRAQTPLQALGSQRLCSRPPSPARSSSAPAPRRRLQSDVTARDARRYFLVRERRGPATAGAPSSEALRAAATQLPELPGLLPQPSAHPAAASLPRGQ